MKHILTLAIFLCASSLAFAQFNHVETGPNGNKIAEGQYNADPGINPGDSKDVIAQKMGAVHKIGSWKYWFDNGQLSAEEHYDNNGNVTGVWKTWYNDGKLASEIDYTTGKAVYYHPNGAKSEEGTVNQYQQRTGKWQGWFEDGKLNYIGSFDNAGRKDGVWQYYDDQGNIVGTEHYSQGAMVN
ncbi:MAG TPA: hypothetical protein VFU15_12380 [Bacteroidia bacterium]|nr:hypothetical protein [Bacteroidia bacterium]